MVADDPIGRFRQLFERARSLEGGDARAAALATADAEGRPSVRMIVLASIDDDALVFCTSYESRKARDLGQNPRAALCLHWPSLSSQVRIEGRVTRASAEQSDCHFGELSRGTQVSAWATRQSEPLGSRSELISTYRDVEARWKARPIPRPESWGAYLLAPDAIEFWHRYENRLHDRLLYVRDGEGWRLERIAP